MTALPVGHLPEAETTLHRGNLGDGPGVLWPARPRNWTLVSSPVTRGAVEEELTDALDAHEAGSISPRVGWGPRPDHSGIPLGRCLPATRQHAQTSHVPDGLTASVTSCQNLPSPRHNVMCSFRGLLRGGPMPSGASVGRKRESLPSG